MPRPGAGRHFRPHRIAAPARCSRSRPAVRRIFPSVASGRRPRSRSCCCPPVPSTPPLPSPGTSPNSSCPSRHALGRPTPPEPGPLSAPTCAAVRHMPGSGPRRQRISWLRSVGPPLTVGIFRNKGLSLGLIGLDQPPQPCYPGLLPEAAGSWQAEKGGAGRVRAQTAGYTQRHAQTWLPLVRYDSASRRSFMLTFKTVAIGCSLLPGGFLFQNHYPRFRGAPFCFFSRPPTRRRSVD